MKLPRPGLRRDRQRDQRGGARAAARAAEGAAPLPPLHPAALAALFVAALCVVVSVSYRLYEGDAWHHLLVGRVIWETHAVPTTQLWSWPTWGAPEANSAWGFRALIWPFWTLGGVPGLFVWRWISTLAAFTILWVAARRMGSRGLAPLLALVLCALVYSQRSDIRPETLVVVWLALEIMVLEIRRDREPRGVTGRALGDPALWLIPIAWAWVNTHVSFPLFFLVLGTHLVATRASGKRRLWGIAALCALVLLLNPFGWRALGQPFEFALHLRGEPMYRLIAELKPVDWSLTWRTGLPILVAAWPLLIVWRARRHGLDVAEAVLCAAFTTLALSTQRFTGFYAIVAAAYVARDLDGWVRSRRWPRWSRPPWARALITAGACALVGLPEWTWSRLPLGIGLEMGPFPVRACDFAAAHGIGGRGFNHMHQGAYIAWRAWPNRARLPFITGTPEAASAEQRALYVGAFSGARGWQAIDARYRFDYAILDRRQDPGDALLDVLDQDPAWAAVFMDDAAALFVRRDGARPGLADSFAFREVPAGRALRESRLEAWLADPARRARALDELTRQIEASPANAQAHRMLADLAGFEGRLPEARAQLERALAADPRLPKAHLMLAGIALEQGRPRDALRELQMERVYYGDRTSLDRWTGLAYQALGDLGRARTHYRRALARDPGDAAARDSLAAVERALARGR